MIIFFASMAHYFSEHASQAVSRESVAALIPLEKHVKLAQPLSQKALKSARNFTGANSVSLAQVEHFFMGCGARQKSSPEPVPREVQLVAQPVGRVNLCVKRHRYYLLCQVLFLLFKS